MEDIDGTFPSGKRVAAQVGAFVVYTDQPVADGGGDSAPAPFDLFLASLATCTGLYVLAFCQARGLAIDGHGLRQHVGVDPATKLPTSIRLELRLPPTFPEKCQTAILRAAQGCKVKKTLAARPNVEVVLEGQSTDEVCVPRA